MLNYGIHRNELQPPHDKTNKMTVRQAKSQISLGLHTVIWESSLCAQWVAKDTSFLHADSEDSDQTGRMPMLIWVFTGHMRFCWFCREVAEVYSYGCHNSALHDQQSCWQDSSIIIWSTSQENLSTELCNQGRLKLPCSAQMLARVFGFWIK